MIEVALPDGWDRRRLRFDAQFNPMKSGLSISDETEISFVPMEAVGEYGGLQLDQTRPLGEVYAGYTYFADGDLCIAKITPCFENGKGALAAGLANGIGFGTTELHVVRPAETLDARYLFYISMASDFRSFGASEMLGAGGQKRVPEAFLKDWRAPLPPLKTQKRIAAFLDAKTAQIDALIASKHSLLERLAEKRQAVVTQGVTKGLNPAAQMKDSGIDWLGQIPAHWNVWPLKRVISTSTYGVSASLEPTGNVAILRMGNLQNGELDFADLRYLDEVDAGLLLEPRDVVFNRTNSLDLVGKAAIYRGNYDGQLSLASYLVLFRFDDRYDPEFANYVMSADVLMALGRTLALPSIGQANLNPNRYAAIEFPVPPMDEQIEIAAHIAGHLALLSEAEGQITASIAKLAEYRSALITSAVSGQIEGFR